VGLPLIYAVERVDGEPYLLALLRWPELSEVVGRNKPTWNYDPGLRDMIYDCSGASVSEEYARILAATWSATCPVDDDKPAAKDDASFRP
jgi:hypothetical protein